QAREYTLPEIIDILNDVLLPHKLVLVRRESMFTIMPIDERIDPSILPRVRIEDLPERGRTEYVQVAYQLKTLKAKEVVPDVKKILGQFGEVTALSMSNQLILQDTAGNLRKVIEFVMAIEAKQTPGETLAYVCRFVRARDAAQKAREK